VRQQLAPNQGDTVSDRFHGGIGRLPWTAASAARTFAASLAIPPGKEAHANQKAPWTVAVPVAVVVLCLWFLHDRPDYGWTRLIGPLGAAVVLFTPLTGHALPLTGVILAGVVGLKLADLRQRAA